MAKVLQMVFKNQENRNFTISIEEPREDLTGAEVGVVMNTIISKNIFETNGGELKEAAGARIVDTQVTELELA